MAHPTIHSGLVVDDEAAIRLATTRALAAEGIVCDVAANGAQALDMIRHSKYDVVVTDLRMPETNGHALAIELLALPLRPVIVVLTGILEPKLLQDLKIRGVDDVHVKPVEYRQFAARVRQLADVRAAAIKTQAPNAKSEDSTDGENSGPVQAATGGTPTVEGERKNLALQIAELSAHFPAPTPGYDGFKLLSSGSLSTEDISLALKQDPNVVASVLSLFNRAIFSSRIIARELEQKTHLGSELVS